MLPCACLCDNSGLAHVLSEQRLADTIVNLVSACVVQVLSFQIDLGTTSLRRQPLCKIERRSAPYVFREVTLKLFLKSRVLT